MSIIHNSVYHHCRSTSRSWKTIYAVLVAYEDSKSGGNFNKALLHFRDKQEYNATNQVPFLAIDINESNIEIPDSYTKKKNVFRLITDHGGWYLYHANSQEVLENWLGAILHLDMTRNAAET